MLALSAVKTLTSPSFADAPPSMLCARPIMRVVGVPVPQVTGWVFSALQAGLGVQAIISALRALQVSTGG